MSQIMYLGDNNKKLYQSAVLKKEKPLKATCNKYNDVKNMAENNEQEISVVSSDTFKSS